MKIISLIISLLALFTNAFAQHDMHNMNKPTVEIKENKGEDFIPEKVFTAPGKTVIYHLYITDTVVNFTGKERHAYAINGSIPGPELVFTEGDTAEIYLHNMLKNEETSLHWHGIILPNQADGVPYLTTTPIKPGETHLYKFPVVQNGTYWYHSHSSLQEQAGIYGALIFKKREESPEIKNKLFDFEYTLVLSEWTDEDPNQVQRRLRTGSDWYAIKKHSVQSYAEAIKADAFKTKIINEWKRMKAMDVSDVYYDKFLSNGKTESAFPKLKAGDKIKIRVVNAGASSYFWLQFAGGKITVVANDGNDVMPVEVDRLIIGVAETYDIIVTIPENMSYELRATPEDRTSFTSLWLGDGMKMYAPVLPKLKYFEGMKMMNDMMKMNGDMESMGMMMSNQTMDMNVVMYPEITGFPEEKIKDMKMESDSMDHHHHHEDMDQPGPQINDMDSMSIQPSGDLTTLNYSMLRSPVKTILPDTTYKILHFTLTGNMNRYVWSINNKVVNEWDQILILKGENVKIIITNNSMMRHPMHLHGHDFRVLNGQGEYAPLKNVIDILPMETDTIEFAANQNGNWFFHCHILYHMMSGMGNVFTYYNSTSNPELPNAEKAFQSFKKDNTMFHFMGKASIESNGIESELMLSTNRYALNGMSHTGYSSEHGYEAEINFGRYIGKMQWLFPYVGFDLHYKVSGVHDDNNIFGDEMFNMLGQISNKNDRKTFIVGFQYTLPMLFIADARVDGDGKFRFQLSREDIPISSRLRLNLMLNTDKEYTAGMRYNATKWLSISTHYDSDMSWGAGITLTY